MGNRDSLALCSALVCSLSAVGGCSLQSVSAIYAPFPPAAKTQIACKYYRDFPELAVDLRKMEQEGWIPRVTGHEHEYLLWGFALSSQITVCYEAEIREGEPLKKDPTRKGRNGFLDAPSEDRE
jgi:hypothetical protein